LTVSLKSVRLRSGRHQIGMPVHIEKRVPRRAWKINPARHYRLDEMLTMAWSRLRHVAAQRDAGTDQPEHRKVVTVTIARGIGRRWRPCGGWEYQDR